MADVLDLDGHHVAAGRIERVFGRDEDVLDFARFAGGLFLPLAVLFGACRRRPDEAETLLGPLENAHHPRPGVFRPLVLARGLRQRGLPSAGTIGR